MLFIRTPGSSELHNSPFIVIAVDPNILVYQPSVLIKGCGPAGGEPETAHTDHAVDEPAGLEAEVLPQHSAQSCEPLEDSEPRQPDAT